MKKSIIITISLFFLFLGCSSPSDDNCDDTSPEINILPTLNFDYSIEDFNLKITGSTKDENGIVSEITINWGDNNTEELDYSELTNFEKNHIYKARNLQYFNYGY